MCIDICPVGALTSGTYRYQTRPWEMQHTSTICAHCSNGCKVTLSVRNHRILRANNRDLSGINREFLCIKGRFGFDFVHHPERLTQPLLRRNGALVAASWEEALGEVTSRLVAILGRHGPAALGVIGSNRTTNEENYVLQRLARATLGTNNVDHHRTADYAGLVTAVGSARDSLATLEQLGTARAILLIGSDPTQQHPLVAWQMRAAVRLHGARLHIINAAPIRLRRKAAHFVQVAAGTEAQVLRWLATGEGTFESDLMLELMVLKAAIEKETDVVMVFGPEVEGGALQSLVAYGSRLPGRTRYLALGDYANSRGAADMGLHPAFLPGYAGVGHAGARQRFGELWGTSLPAAPGLDAHQMLGAAVAGTLKALYVVGANPVKTFRLPGMARLGGLELLVVQEMFLTETAQLADVVLPAACAYEKDGTVTNTAGEVQMLRKALDPPAGARSDFDLLRILSYRLGKAGVGRAMPFRTPEEAWDEIRQHVGGYDVAAAALLAGGAEPSSPAPQADPAPVAAPAGTIFSSRDTLFTSGTLGRYCAMVRSVPEAKAEP